MNTLDITRLDDGRVRVTIRSEGERDQHVDLATDDLLRFVAAGTSNPDSGNISSTMPGTVTYGDPQSPAVGEPPTATPGDGAAFTETADVAKTDAEGGTNAT